jgi:hypothetical protein
MEEIILDVGRTVVNSARKSGDYAAVNYSETEGTQYLSHVGRHHQHMGQFHF